MTLPKNYSIEQVAAECGVCERTVRRWLSSGVIRGVRVGPKLIRIPRAEVERLLSAPVGGAA